MTRQMPFADVQLIIQLRDSAMRWSLSEGTRVEVWRGTQLLGILSGETLRQLMAQHLSTVALVTAMQAHLTGDPPDEAVSPTKLPPRPMPSKDMLDASGKAARRAARRSRAKRKLASLAMAAWVAGSLLLLGWDCVTDLVNATPRVAVPVAQRLP